MPITYKIETERINILVWEITETLDQLKALYGNINITNYASEKRKKEHLISRLMVNEICKNGTIIYNKFGAPELDNNKHLSISHSKELVTVIVSEKKSGIDIEKISEKSMRLASKFVSEKNLIKLNKEKAVTINSNGDVFIDNIQVIVADIVADNGVVHVIDAVLLPITTLVSEINELNNKYLHSVNILGKKISRDAKNQIILDIYSNGNIIKRYTK